MIKPGKQASKQHDQSALDKYTLHFNTKILQPGCSGNTILCLMSSTVTTNFEHAAPICLESSCAASDPALHTNHPGRLHLCCGVGAL